MSTVRPTGHLQIKGSAGHRRWFALWRDAEGRHQRLLGVAHVKDSGRRTARGAVIWRVGDGPAPSPDHLTPADTATALRELLVSAPKQVAAPGERRAGEPVSFGQACAEWLRYIEQERRRTPSTLADYRSTVRASLLPGFGADTPLRDIDTATIDAWWGARLSEGRLSPRTIQKQLTLLHGILKRAKRKGWIAVKRGRGRRAGERPALGRVQRPQPRPGRRGGPRRRHRSGRDVARGGRVHRPAARRARRIALLA